MEGCYCGWELGQEEYKYPQVGSLHERELVFDKEKKISVSST